MSQSATAPSTITWKLTGLIGWMAICLAAMWLGAAFTFPAVEGWYAGLERPDWTPPDWVFGPVWFTLYVLMALAAWMIWTHPEPRGKRLALTLFSIQLVLNVAWSGFFFGLQSPLWGLIDIALLWLAIVATLIAFFRKSPWGAALLVPYLLWVSYAAALNYQIWQLNA